MKQDRPWFPFYAGDWTTNQKLRRCPHELKGVWIDVLCLMHESEEYGVLRWPMAEIATAVGASRQKLEELATRGILKGAHAGAMCEAFGFFPVHARKRGAWITLIAEQQGPIWFSSRMVEDEYKRLAKQGITTPDHSPKPPFGDGGQPHQSPPLVIAESAPDPSPLMRAGETDDRDIKNSSASSDAVASDRPDRKPLELVVASKGPSLCPHEQLVEAYHRAFPGLARIRKLTAKRRQHLTTRWREDPKRQTLDWWERLFAFVSESPFLMGQRPGRNGGPSFELTIDFLVGSEDNLVKIIEGRYHRETA